MGNKPGGNNPTGKGGKKFSSTWKPQEVWLEEDALQLANELLEYMKEDTKENLFWSYFITVKKGLSRNILNYLRKKFDSLDVIIKECEEIQKDKLIHFGVLEKTSSPMTKFVMANKYGWRERAHVESVNNNIDLSKLSEEERKLVLAMARKVEK